MNREGDKGARRLCFIKSFVRLHRLCGKKNIIENE
jgi:hypothetical protein